MRRGRIFLVGLMVVYLIAALAAIVLLTFGIVTKLNRPVGAVQNALLAAEQRTEQQLFYTERAAQRSLNAAANLLYTDQAAFFSTATGDDTGGLGCGSYVNPLWNTPEKECLIGDGLATVRQRILDALAPRFNERLSQQTLAYPFGPYTIAYALSPPTDNKVYLDGPDQTEPILIGLPGTKGSQPIETEYRGAAVISKLVWPSSGSKTITSCFGPRYGVQEAASDVHKGMDLPADGEVLAAADGVVMNDPMATKYHTVWIKHSEQLSTGYLHLREVDVKKGDTIKAGQRIGAPGDVGCAAAGCKPHLHFEVLVHTPPKGTSHAYTSPYASGWYAVNPACFFPAVTDDAISPSATQSCLAPGYPKPATKAYCAEYGFTLAEATSPTTQKENVSRPSENLPALASDAPPKASQQKLTQTWQRMNRLGWDKYVIKAASDYGLSQALLLGIITQESVGDPDAISGTGCVGLMQICKSTGEDAPTLRGHMTTCGYNCKLGTCACTKENDFRFDLERNVQAGAYTFNRKIGQFNQYTDKRAFGIAAYNGGEGVIKAAIEATGNVDPSWNDVATYLKKHPEVLARFKDFRSWTDARRLAKVTEITEYVDLVLAYTRAWNKGVALDPGRAASLARVKATYGPVTQVGTYTYSPDMVLSMPDAIEPFLALLSWADTTLTRCASADVPGDCLLDAAKTAQTEVKTVCEDDPGTQYFVEFYEALRDCAENGQDGCQCALPLPAAGSNATLMLDPRRRVGVVYRDGAAVPGLAFENISNQTLRVDVARPEGVVPLWINLTLGNAGFVLSYKENQGDPVSWQPGWVVEKTTGRLVFRASSSGAERCAPVKTKYAFCSEVGQGMPPVKFALTLKDETKPGVVTGIQYDPSAATVSFTASPSKDVSFYNVYTERPLSGVAPALQLRDGKTSFGAAAYAGKTLFVTPVDRAGNEGVAASVTITGT